MISPSGEFDASHRGCVHSCVKSSGGKPVPYEIRDGCMARRCYTRIQDLSVQPNQDSSRRGGIPHETTPKVTPQGIEGNKQAGVHRLVAPPNQKPPSLPSSTKTGSYYRILVGARYLDVDPSPLRSLQSSPNLSGSSSSSTARALGHPSLGRASGRTSGQRRQSGDTEARGIRGLCPPWCDFSGTPT